MDFKINLDFSQVIHITAPEHDNDVVSISSKTYVFDNDAKISLIIQKAPGSSQVIRQLTVGNGLEVVEGALQIRFEGGRLQNGRYYYEAFDIELGKRIFRGWLHLLPSAYHFAVSHEENAFNGGKSAYKHWLDAGNTGQLADFLEAIKGEKGDVLGHEWNGTSLRLEKPDGSFGDFVNLIGRAFVYEDFTLEQREGLILKFNQLTQDEKDSLKLLFEHLSPEDKDSLRLKFEHLTDVEKDSIMSPRLLEIETETEATLIFNETSPSELMTRVNNSTTTSVPVTLNNTIPVGWSKIMRQSDSGVFNFVDHDDITIIKRDGLLLQTVNKMDTVHILCIDTGVFEIDGDLKSE